jgi:hypothetical protein
MARIFVILAFVTILGLAIPAVNAVSPFQVHPNDVSNPASSANFWEAPAGCSSSSSATKCNASVSSGSTNSGIFGPVVNTILVFGNFFAAASFLVNLAIAVIVPGAYIMTWLGGPNNATAVAIAGMFQAAVWVAYALDFFYIISGRFLSAS